LCGTDGDLTTKPNLFRAEAFSMFAWVVRDSLGNPHLDAEDNKA